MDRPRLDDVLGLVLGASVLAGLAGCTHSQPAQRPAAPAQPPAAAASASAPEAKSPPVALAKTKPVIVDAKVEPPDGHWLTDENGRMYFLAPAPRIDGQYRWENDERTRVRLAYGLIWDVASYDEDGFMLKVYRPDDPAVSQVRRIPTPEDKAAAAKEFAFATPTVDRLAFGEFDQGLPHRGQWRHGFGIADLDGDGHLDIAHGPARKGNGRPTVFLSDGHGVWRTWPTTFPDIMLDYGDAAVADFDGDGHVDLALAVHLRGLVVFRGDGRGGFTSWSQGLDLMGAVADRTTPPFSSRAIRVADWNGDGRPDLVAIGEGPRFATSRDVEDPKAFQQGSHGVRVFLNQGDGTWKTSSEEGTRVYGNQLAVADLDADGHLDVVSGVDIVGYQGLLAYGTADGGFRRALLPGLRPGGLVRAVETGDFDGDGRADIAVGYLSLDKGAVRTGVDVYLARGSEWKRETVWNSADRREIWALSAGDADGDGHLDLAAATGAGEVELFLGDGKGGFSHELAPELSIGDPNCRAYSVHLTDLDRDGLADVAVDFSGEGNELMGERLCPTGGSLRVWKGTARE